MASNQFGVKQLNRNGSEIPPNSIEEIGDIVHFDIFEAVYGNVAIEILYVSNHKCSPDASSSIKGRTMARIKKVLVALLTVLPG